MAEIQRDPERIAIMLLKATAFADEKIFTDPFVPKYTTVDYYRMACHMLFECQQCGTCCTTGEPIRLRPEDVAFLAKMLKIPRDKALRKYTVPDPNKPGILNFKHILPCKFYDSAGRGCKIYKARPWSCRIFPFLGIYGSEDRVSVNESCPGAVKTMNILTGALENARKDPNKFAANSCSPEEVRNAKEFLRAVLDI